MNDARKKTIGRFAPTPSGEMHLGNLMCALLAYLSAKHVGGEFLVRIEDLDALRCPRPLAQKILDTLHTFGLDSDREPVYQSERGELYAQKEEVLRRLGLTYPCFCTRAQLHAAEAPRLSDGGVIYAGTCRGLSPDEREELSKTRRPCTRVAVPDKVIAFTDGLCGEYSQNLKDDCGDFIIRRSDGVYAYQLAVVVDDGEAGVTEVLRGADLIASTPRQLWLMRLLGYPAPKYLHIPLVVDSRGRKLSKSEGDRIAHNVKRLSKERILGALAYSAGIIADDRAAELPELVELFAPEKLKRGTIRLSEVLE